MRADCKGRDGRNRRKRAADPSSGASYLRWPQRDGINVWYLFDVRDLLRVLWCVLRASPDATRHALPPVARCIRVRGRTYRDLARRSR